MKKLFFFLLIIILTSCVSKQKYTQLENENLKLKTELNNLEKKVVGLDEQNMEFLKQLEECTKQNKK